MFLNPQPKLFMKLVTSLIASLFLAASVFAGCPSKTIKGKVVSFDADSKTLTVKQGKKEKQVKVSSKTAMDGFECPTKLAAGDNVSIDGCNCSSKKASKIALAKK
jgi:ribosomal protein S17